MSTRRPRAAAPGAGAGAGARSAGLLLAVCLLAVACASSPRPIRAAQDVYDPNPSIRAQAASELARVGRRDQVPLLIELLDDPDEVVRLAAGRALVLLTGHDTGYVPFAPPEECRHQRDLWRAWWAQRQAAGGR